MTKIRRALGLLLTSVFITTSAVAAKAKIVVTGSSTIAPMLSEMAKRYERFNPEVRIDVQSGGSSRGVTDVRKRIADVGMVSRALKADEKDLSKHLLARDGVAMIVHRDNPIVDLTEDQVRAIYTGKIKSWKELGWKDHPITVVSKAEGRSTLEVFTDHFKLNVSELKPSTIIGENEQAIQLVSSDSKAIAYVSIGTALSDQAQGVPIRLPTLGRKIASEAAVAQGTYPMSRELNVVTQGDLKPETKQFVGFLLSKDVQDLVTQFHFIEKSAR